jgi:hypothetical protein
LKLLGPTRQPCCPKNGACPCRLPFDCGRHRSTVPIASARHRPRPQLAPPLPTASGGYTRSTLTVGATPFFLLRRFITIAPPCLPSLSHCEPLLRPLSESPVTSLDPHASGLGCSSVPPLSLPAARFAPPWNPLLQ